MATYTRSSLSLLYDEFPSHVEAGRAAEALDVMVVANYAAGRIQLGQANRTLTSRFPYGVLESPEPVSEE